MIGLIIIATDKYHQFLPGLLESARKYFLPHVPIVFSDGYALDGTLKFYQKHLPFPEITLRRYEIINRQAEILSNFEYLFYIDADSKFIAPVGKEVLGNMAAVLHRSFLYNRGTFESRPESMAYIADNQNAKYYCGGFNGGKDYLKMSKKLEEMIATDKKNGIMAIWHDESHLNRYLFDNPPDVLLDPGYMYPEGDNYPFTQRILNLQAYKTLRKV